MLSGYGFTPGSDRLIFKAIIGYAFPADRMTYLTIEDLQQMEVEVTGHPGVARNQIEDLVVWIRAPFATVRATARSPASVGSCGTVG
jgi:hypothetical protein